MALVLALFADPAMTTIDDKTLAAAIELAVWFGNESARFYRDATETRDDRQLRELAEWINSKHAGVVTPWEVVQGRRAVKTVAEAEALLNRLAKAGFRALRVIPSGTKPRHEFRLAGASTSTNLAIPQESGRNVDVDIVDAPEATAFTDDGWEVA